MHFTINDFYILHLFRNHRAGAAVVEEFPQNAGCVSTLLILLLPSQNQFFVAVVIQITEGAGYSDQIVVIIRDLLGFL